MNLSLLTFWPSSEGPEQPQAMRVARFSPSLAYTLMCTPEAEAIIRHHLLPGLPLEWVTDPIAFRCSVCHQASLNQLELQLDLLYLENQQRFSPVEPE